MGGSLIPFPGLIHRPRIPGEHCGDVADSCNKSPVTLVPEPRGTKDRNQNWKLMGIICLLWDRNR